MYNVRGNSRVLIKVPTGEAKPQNTATKNRLDFPTSAVTTPNSILPEMIRLSPVSPSSPDNQLSEPNQIGIKSN